MVVRFGRVAKTPDAAARLAAVEHEVTAAHAEPAAARARIAQLTTGPALPGQPLDLLTRERDPQLAVLLEELHQAQGRPAIDRLGVDRPVGALEVAHEVADERLPGLPHGLEVIRPLSAVPHLRCRVSATNWLVRAA